MIICVQIFVQTYYVQDKKTHSNLFTSVQYLLMVRSDAQGVEGRSRRSRPSTAGCAGSESGDLFGGKLMEIVGNPVCL